MRQVPLVDLVEPAVSGFWGDAPGSCEVDVRVIRNGDVQAGGTLRWSEIPLRGYTLRELSKAEVRCGDLVLTTSGNCGHVAYIDRSLSEPLCASNFLRILRPRASIVDSRYLFHLLNSERFRLMLAPFIRGSTLQNLSYTKAAAAVALPLPPLEEQRRIAAILDKADELRAKRRAALDKLDSLTQSIFLDMFGDPGNPPQSMSIRELGDVASFLDSLRKPVRASDRTPGNVPYYGANGVQDYIDGHIFDEPLVLLAEDGGHFEEPRRGIAYRIEGRSWVNNHAHVIRAGDLLDTWYLTWSLRHRDVRAFLTGSTRHKLTKSAAERIPVAVPPIESQRKFGRAAEQIQHGRQLLEQSRAELDRWFDALQSRAFRGEL